MSLLGQSLYYCFAELYGQTDRLPHWQGLTCKEQHVWVQRAADVMDSLRPQAAPSLFQRIADVARTEAAKVLSFRGQDDSQGRD